MIFRKSILCFAFFLGLLVSAAEADVFNMGGGAKSLEFVPVGDKGNAADVTGFGAVDHDYQIGKFEVTAGQYAEFLTAVASSSDPFGLYNPSMATTQYGSKIILSAGVYTALQPNMPVNYVSWGDAVRFCNWLQNGQTTGVEDESTTEDGAYSILRKTSSAELLTVTRNSIAKYVLPSYDEWYKAAYYDPNKKGLGVAGYWGYPTKHNPTPSNVLSTTGTNNANFLSGGFTLNPPNTTEVGAFASSLSAYGTFDQAGNVEEWNETVVSSESRGIHGGSFMDGSSELIASDRIMNFMEPTWEVSSRGFRVAEVPEPSTLLLLLLGSVAGIAWCRRRNEA